jgi:signal transduction histidine kinase/CheY-like chemotaxis protein
MGRFRKFMAVSFRAKVLVPVIGVMVLLVVTMAWVINHRITLQFEDDAKSTLARSDSAFHEIQKNRAKNLLLRVHDLRNEPRFKAALQTGDSPTIRKQLKDLYAAVDQEVDIVLCSTANELIGAEKFDPLISIGNFQSASADIVGKALGGEETVGTIHVDGRLYDVVSIPVYNTEDKIIGALTFGSEIGSKVVEEFGRTTHSKIILLANDKVVVSTLPVSDSSLDFGQLFKELISAKGQTAPKREIIGGEHYFCAGGRFAFMSDGSHLGYLLLSSYETPLRDLQTTQQILIGISALAILLGSAVVCFLVGKVTKPLRELRDSAEAVGRGDFSRRVTVRYEDECGELAGVFNRMTENLKKSREQLEMTVETLKTTQAQLIQSEKLSGIGEFIAGVAHELNNPLTSVIGFSELLQQAEFDAKYKRYMEMINKSALRCQKIVQALLSFARRRAPERKVVCVNSLIDASVEILQYQLRTSNIEMIVRLDPNLPHAMVDPHQIQQVLVNIINNGRQAIEAHQPKGWIKVQTEARGGFVVITIQDSGPGITSENLSKIFDPFFTTKEVGTGTGLGLSLCYGIIKDHGGTIKPFSKTGEGATFVIELPITHEAEQTVEDSRFSMEPLNGSHEGKGKKVLIIDDEEPILHMIREMLTARGYEVDVASDGETGLRHLGRKKYDVMLCDWKMPGLTGQQVYERIRVAHPTLCNRVIFITGDIINDKARQFLEQQNKICLAKPFTLPDFHAAIRKVLAEN